MKDRTDRQQRVLQELEDSGEPITGTDLAKRCLVTRQVVVHDIALLRAAGVPIVSTPRGYFVTGNREGSQRGVLAMCHPPELTAIELLTLVDHGVHVINVIVDHPLYGELTGGLHLASRKDVELFLEQIREQRATLLSSLTAGQHMHTVEYTDGARLREAVSVMRAHGIEVSE